MRHFRHDLYGHQCTVYTDHEALKSLLNTPHPSGKLARWGMAIQELDLKIEYRPGKENGQADALSRYPISTQSDGPTETVPVLLSSIQTEIQSGEETEIQSGEETEIQSGEETEIQSGEETEIQSGEETEIQSREETEIQSGEETEIQSGEETEIQTTTQETVTQGGETPTTAAAAVTRDTVITPTTAVTQDTVVTPTTTVIQDTVTQDGENTAQHFLSERQYRDPELRKVIQYLQSGVLPEDDVEARKLTMNEGQYSLVDGVLYHLDADKSLKIIPPTVDRETIFREAHQGVFSGHLREAKIHGQLARHYWWPRMRRDIAHWCRACLTCASRYPGRPIRPQITPIPVSGPFDRVGVDILQLPKTKRGNWYAVVFVDYLTKWPEVYATQDQTAPTIAKLLVEGIISRHGIPN